jgi:hypothetical protein
MRTLRAILLTVVTLIPLAELLFVPVYLAHRTTVDLNLFTESHLDLCVEPEGGCTPVPGLGQ